MKKVYERPGIFFENFSLSTNIAADCDFPVNFAQNTCGIEEGTGGIVVFTDGIGSLCTHRPSQMGNVDDMTYDGYCYHVPDGVNNMFSS